MSTTPPTPSDGDRNDPVEPANGPVPPSESSPPGEPSEARNGTGVAALVCGVLAVLSILLFPPGMLVFGIAAVVLGIMGVRRAKRGEATNKSQATVGLVAGIVAVVVFGVVTVTFFVQNEENLAEFRDCVEAAATQDQRDECQRRFEEEIGR